MGGPVSPGAEGGQFRRSYGSMDNLARQLAHVLSAADWRSVRYLFDRPSGEPFTVPPGDAGRAAEVLHRASAHRLMPDDWSAAVHELAETADRAAGAGEPWAWT